jgi:hypothetical protein
LERRGLLGNNSIRSGSSLSFSSSSVESNPATAVRYSSMCENEKIKIRRITGACVTCAGISKYYLIYDLDGCSKIERYCGPCIEKEKEKKMEIANLMSNFDFPNISKYEHIQILISKFAFD